MLERGMNRTDVKLVSLERAMVPHSSIVAWGVLWMEEPGVL